jgi:hypothetical protein
LRVAEALGGEFVLLVEVEVLVRGDLVGEGEERKADATGFVVEVEALGGGGAPVVACRELVVVASTRLTGFDKFFSRSMPAISESQLCADMKGSLPIGITLLGTFSRSRICAIEFAWAR